MDVVILVKSTYLAEIYVIYILSTASRRKMFMALGRVIMGRGGGEGSRTHFFIPVLQISVYTTSLIVIVGYPRRGRGGGYLDTKYIFSHCLIYF